MSWVAPTRGDLVLAAVVTAFGVASVLATAPSPGVGVERPTDGWAVLLAVLATAPLGLRRSAPVGVVGVTGAAFVAAAVLGYAGAAAGLGIVLATTSAAYLTDRRGAVVAAALFAASAGAATVLAFDGEPGVAVQLATSLVLGGLAAAVGDTLRILHARNRELDALRAVEAREAVAQDRVRIAREVHDVVGHALAGIALQARAGRRLLDRDPPRAGEALREIDELATRALGETREAIGRIRGAEDRAELRPQPRLEDLDELVGRLRDGDLDVRLRRDGDGEAVPATVQASAFRIVQEALSNVVKHAGPASVDVRVTTTGDAVEVEVRDDGRRAPGPVGRGHGIRGMRERAAQVGGAVDAGPAPGGGWRVQARLPVPGRRA
ncbi:sensor histidine kinase [Patulibacter sp. SYSU D01012]|uniref:sensor histidine kinase n=1 Tax=Patulibacter sp. SYSU D01012 TaxID=2817381 RepID=UPI001B309078